MENEITLSWHLRSSIESTAGVQSMLDTYIFFSIWFPLVEKKQPYIETKQFFFNRKLAKETSTHLIWNHQFKNLMNLSESILIYIILVTYSFPPPPLLIRFLCPYPCCHWKSPHLTSGGLEPSAAARRTTLLDQSWWPQGRLEANLCKAWQGSKALPWQRCWSSGNLSKGHVLTYDTSL